MDSLAEIDGIGASQRQNRQMQRFRIERGSPLIRFDAQDGQVEIRILRDDPGHIVRFR